MKKITRYEAIEILILADTNTIHTFEGYCYLCHILRNGVKGYKNYTNKELQKEYNKRMTPKYEKIEIIKE